MHDWDTPVEYDTEEQRAFCHDLATDAEDSGHKETLEQRGDNHLVTDLGNLRAWLLTRPYRADRLLWTMLVTTDDGPRWRIIGKPSC